ncbi:TIGR03067 domain-containing protein [Singulisphaera sp. Ch08]|uniref:TIGR03067 domain-containing protein n=1 Tax=Singulisphaera sp. Ch08 TaxID=3120278 RepID=A0AAU7C6N8_9BACT
MTWQPALVMMFGLLAAIGGEEVESDTKKIQGVWNLVSTESDGQVVASESLKGRDARMVLEDDRVIMKMGEKSAFLGTFKLDPSRTPRWYDRTYSDGTPRRGIYRLEGDSLTICLAGLGKDRPTAFGTKQGDGLSLLVYQREKP